MDSHAISKEVKNTLKKILQSLLEESEEEDDKKEEVLDNQPKSKKDIGQEIFEDVTLDERKRFYQLLNKFKRFPENR